MMGTSFSYLMNLKSILKETIEVMIYRVMRLIAVGQRNFDRMGGIRNDWVNHSNMYICDCRDCVHILGNPTQ